LSLDRRGGEARGQQRDEEDKWTAAHASVPERVSLASCQAHTAILPPGTRASSQETVLARP
jgi:hypothetical protein